MSAQANLLPVPYCFAASPSQAPSNLLRPKQVHGARVVSAERVDEEEEADAIVARGPGITVGIVTADCVPILACSEGGVVAAIHAGWRGLSAGVIEAGILALQQQAPGELLFAAVGPCAGPCCYEVDQPVLNAFEAWDEEALAAAVTASRPGHVWLDLPRLARDALESAGIAGERIAQVADGCTICHDHFQSVRRQGSRAGRMLHWIATGMGGRDSH